MVVKPEPSKGMARRLIAAGMLGVLVWVAGGCASNGPGASYVVNQTLRGESWQTDLDWTPGVHEWPPSDWLERPIGDYLGVYP